MNKQWVIPDIHGCVKTMAALIEHKIKPEKTDLLIFLGDYIDRGPNSKGVMDYIIKLKDLGFQTYCLIGNHEEAMLRAYKKELKQKKKFFFLPKKNKPLKFWMGIGGEETLSSFNIKKIGQIDKKYIDWIENLEYYFLHENFVVVHAGLNFNIEDPFSDKESMTKIRDFTVDFSKTENRRIIHGHVQLSLDFIKSTIHDANSPFIGLDNGCLHKKRVGMGNLIALELNTLQLEIQPNIDNI